MIFAINIVGVVDHVAQTGILSFDLRKELDLFVGFHEGYIQITSHNIGSLFFIAAYLYVYLVSNTSRPKKTQFGVYAALILCLITAALSGRRALWIVLLLVPVVDYIMSILCAVTNQTKSGKMLGLYILLMLVLMYLLLISSFSQNEIMEHVGNAFSNEDERSIQFGYLLASFLEYPILGSGFGGYAGYTRSLDSPWLYELTYLQILFNFGIVGVLLIVIVFLIYFYMVVVNLRDRSVGRGYRAALFIGCVSLLIGAYSNPYLGSFDFLFVVGMIPYVAQFNNRTRST
jgi:O-antigen ligase